MLQLHKLIIMKTKIKLFISEINGVWTDGGFYINGSGNEYMKFHFYDQTGLDLVNETGLSYLIISGEKSDAEEKALKKFQIRNYKLGAKNKLRYLETYLKKNKIKWEEVAYLGSSASDLEVIKKAGLSAAPISAPFYVRANVDWILRRRGGEGAFAEFVEQYLEENNLLKKALNLPDLQVIK